MEISLTKQKEECEQQRIKIKTFDDEREKLEGELKTRTQQLSESQFETEILQKKIESFSKNQGVKEEKNKVKASNYMGEIIQKDKEIQKVRLQLLDLEEEMRQLSITREKFIRERNHLLVEMKQQEDELRDMAENNSAMKRLIQNVYGHVKN